MCAPRGPCVSEQVGRRQPARLPACVRACVPACQPVCVLACLSARLPLAYVRDCPLATVPLRIDCPTKKYKIRIWAEFVLCVFCPTNFVFVHFCSTNIRFVQQILSCFFVFFVQQILFVQQN